MKRVTIFIFYILFPIIAICQDSDSLRLDAKQKSEYDKRLKNIILDIGKSDQEIRTQYFNAIENNKDMNTIDSISQVMSHVDSVNFTKIDALIQEHGWLDRKRIGSEASTVLFLVIQHSELPNQKKYFPFFKRAIKEGNAEKQQFAYLKDRISMREGKRQIYGTQVGQHPVTNEWYVVALKDPKNVDTRRKKMGMKPLSDYVIQWGINWNVQDYLKELPELKKMDNIN